MYLRHIVTFLSEFDIDLFDFACGLLDLLYHANQSCIVADSLILNALRNSFFF